MTLSVRWKSVVVSVTLPAVTLVRDVINAAVDAIAVHIESSETKEDIPNKSLAILKVG